MGAIDDAAKLLRERLKEIDSERQTLEDAARHLTGKPLKTSPTRADPAKYLPKAPRKRRRGSPRKGQSRTDQVIELVRKRPGLTAADIARESGIAVTYVYQLLSGLIADKKVRKEVRRYYPRRKPGRPRGSGGAGAAAPAESDGAGGKSADSPDEADSCVGTVHTPPEDEVLARVDEIADAGEAELAAMEASFAVNDPVKAAADEHPADTFAPLGSAILEREDALVDLTAP